MFRSLLKFNRNFQPIISTTFNFPCTHQSSILCENRLKCSEHVRNDCGFHTTTKNDFWHQDKKGGYDLTDHHITNLQHFKDGFKELKNEIKLWTQEMKHNFSYNPLIVYRPGETDIVWYLDNEEALKGFVTSADSDHSEGFSHCAFKMGKYGRAIFSGNLETRVPKDGRVKKAGYCAFRSVRPMKSFARDTSHDWGMYNTLVLKVRGDGRSYMINLTTEGHFDIHWYDIYQYVLYTRGGPYWQIAKIPFSKFFLSAKGRVQDKQYKIPLSRIAHFGIVCSDKIDGDFSLEIEYIGLELNPDHDEEFAYELYETDKNIANH